MDLSVLSAQVCLYVCMSCLFLSILSVLYVCLLVGLSIYPDMFVSVCLSVCPCSYVCMFPHPCLSICLSMCILYRHIGVYVSIHPIVCVSIHTFVCLYVLPSNHLSSYLSVGLPLQWFLCLCPSNQKSPVNPCVICLSVYLSSIYQFHYHVCLSAGICQFVCMSVSLCLIVY